MAPRAQPRDHWSGRDCILEGWQGEREDLHKIIKRIAGVITNYSVKIYKLTMLLLGCQKKRRVDTDTSKQVLLVPVSAQPRFFYMYKDAQSYVC